MSGKIGSSRSSQDRLKTLRNWDLKNRQSIYTVTYNFTSRNLENSKSTKVHKYGAGGWSRNEKSRSTVGRGHGDVYLHQVTKSCPRNIVVLVDPWSMFTRVWVTSSIFQTPVSSRQTGNCSGRAPTRHTTENSWKSHHYSRPLTPRFSGPKLRSKW